MVKTAQPGNGNKLKEFLYSRNAVYEALRASRRQGFELLIAENVEIRTRLEEIINLARQRKIPVRRVPRQRLDRIHANHQGVAYEVSAYPYSSLNQMLTEAKTKSEPPLLLLLDTLQDPQNLGTLLRTAEIVGVHGVIIPKARTAQITPAVVNASSGATEHLLVAQINLAQAIDLIKEADIWVCGLEGTSEAQLPDRVRLDGPIALVVGSEGQGMRSLVRDSCDFLLRLPMRGKIESLNAAVAGSVALYLVWQARSFFGETSP